MKVSEILENAMDQTGALIRTVYAKKDRIYAVYGTAERVMVQFADEELADLQKSQRTMLAALNPSRGEINGLIDGWRANPNAKKAAAARRYDRRVADALVVALEDDPTHAMDLLTGIKKDIVDERTSLARLQYLLAASVTVALVGLIIWVCSSDWYRYPVPLDDNMWLSIGAGALGAFFSIAIAIRGRTILTDLNFRDNTADAILRIIIGAIGAALIFCMLDSKAVTLALGGADIASAGSCYFFIAGFLAGFSERLIPDLLAKASLSSTPPPSPPAKIGGGPQPTESVASLAAAAASTSTASAAGDPDSSTDSCLSDEPPTDEEATPDSELPPATGGVAPAGS